MNALVKPVRRDFAATGRRALLALVVALAVVMVPQLSSWQSDNSSSVAEARPSAPTIARLEQMTLGQQAKIESEGKAAEQGNALIPFSRLPIEHVAGFRAIGTGDANYPKALKCLSQAVYYEAALESLDGKRAVAQVVLNRVRHPAYPDTVCGVVYQGWNEPVCQFSFVCDGSLLRPAGGPQWRQSEEVAKAALGGMVEADVGTATHYHANYVLPYWAHSLAKVEQVGAHIFYRFPGRWGRSAALTANWEGGERIPAIDRNWLMARLPANEEHGANDATSRTAFVEPLITDRHAENDVGGRLNPAKQWRLSIADPTAAKSSYLSSLERQGAGQPGVPGTEN